MVVSSLPAAISWEMTGRISATVAQSRCGQWFKVATHPHRHITWSPIDSSVGFLGLSARVMEATLRPITRSATVDVHAACLIPCK
jgi:hypothetical protein